ncbi:MAG: Asp-tRNA(Asn)/Glu-tRNA(Gln) amidotransferase subunit GatC [Candidatus Aquicultorales bacterium]
MSISIKDVEHIALLARLGLTGEEKKKFAEQLSHILDHAGKISKLDLADVQATAHAVPVTNVFREDVAGTGFSREQALANAPKQEAGAFAVPKIVGGEDIDV